MKAEISIPVALATATMTWGIYQLALPSHADQRTLIPGTVEDAMAGSSERVALIAAVTLAATVSLLAGDPVPFWFGGGTAVGLSWLSRHARAVDPATNGLPRSSAAEVTLTAGVS
jgi:hypothetical protein